MANQFRVSAGAVEPRMPWSPYGHLRDYAVANRAMVFWLDANAPAERALLEKILRDAGPGTPYLGWFGNDIEGEFAAGELTSHHGVFVVPADWFNNLTVFSGTRVSSELLPSPPPPALENKIYLTLTTLPYVLNRVDHRDVPLSPEKAAVFREQHQAPGILLGWGEKFGTRMIDGLPVSEITPGLLR